MRPTREDIKYLTNSEHRPRILQRLTDGPTERDVLRNELDLSQPTIGRNLNGLEERGWVVRRENRIDITEVGMLVVDGYRRFEGEMEIAQNMALVQQWLSIDEWDVELRHFGDADISLPELSYPLGLVDEASELFGKSERIEGVAPGVFPQAAETTLDAVVTRGQTFKATFTADAVEAVNSHPQMQSNFQELLSFEDVEMYCYTGSIPYGLFVLDDKVLIRVPDDHSHSMRGQIVSTNPQLRRWAERFIHKFIEGSQPLTATDFEQRDDKGSPQPI